MKARGIYILAGVLVLVGFVIFINRESESKNETASLQPKSASDAENEIAKIKREAREKREAWEAKREIERAEAERIEAERLAKWKARFPYKPTYHPTLRYDPKIYRQGDSSTYNDESRRLLQPVTLKHCFLKGFFENPLRFSRQFEQLHDILAEYDRAYDPFILGSIFETTRMYWEAKQYSPDELWGQPDKSTAKYNPSTGKHEFEYIPHDGKTTWGDRVEAYEEGIMANLVWRRSWLKKTKKPASIEEAQEITNRILAEIKGWEDIEGPAFAYIHKYETDIEPNSQLLIPYEGWLEDYRAFQKKEWGWEPPPGHP